MSPSVSTSFLSKSRFFFKRISPRFVSGLACTLLTQLGGQPGCDNCNQGMMIIDHDHNHDHVGNHRLIVISVMRINLLALFLFHLLWHRGANLHGGDDDDVMQEEMMLGMIIAVLMKKFMMTMMSILMTTLVLH